MKFVCSSSRLLLSAWAAAVLTTALSSCGPPVQMHPVKPVAPADQSAAEKRELRKALSLPPEQAAAELLAKLREVQSRIEAGESQSIPSYNHLVARLMEELHQAELGPWSPLPVAAGPAGTFQLQWRDPSKALSPDRELFATDAIRFSGDEAGAPASREGVGAPIILKMPGQIDLVNYDPEKDSFTKRYRNVTAIVRVNDSQAEISLLDPFEVETVRFAGRGWPLAADFTSVTSLSVSTDRPDRLGFSRLIRPERYAKTARLIPAQPYDPNRIPVLLVHGLDSSPVTWFPMYQELMRDPVIRKNYQFWFFSYPSGYPYPYSALLLRQELERVRRKHPDHKDIVLVGHSMGGVINRLILLSPGDRIWRSYFGKPPSETELKGESRQILEDALVFNAQPNVSRAVFFSAPHRGSELAIDWIGRLGSRLVHTPALFADIRDSVVNTLKEDDAASHLNRPANSIDTLSPDDHFVLVTKDLPIAGGVPYHSVMGNRGKSVPKEESSDGVVAYWSSHVDGARSERLVPSGHSSHAHPEGIEELHRILLLHLESR